MKLVVSVLFLCLLLACDPDIEAFESMDSHEDSGSADTTATPDTATQEDSLATDSVAADSAQDIGDTADTTVEQDTAAACAPACTPEQRCFQDSCIPREKFVSGESMQNLLFGESVDYEEATKTAVVGAIESGDPNATGAVYVYERSGDRLELVQVLRTDDAQATGGHLGRSVALSGTRLVVGADGVDAVAPDAGAAYIFEHNGTSWVEQSPRLTPTSGEAGEKFGSAVAIDGDLIVVGAPLEDSNGKRDSGAVYVYAHDGSTWTLLDRLEAGAPDQDFEFGASVAISGNLILVGAPEENAGVVYVFERQGNTVTQLIRLDWVPDTGSDNFGDAVAISGETIVASAPKRDTAANNAGEFGVFGRLSPNSWGVDQALIGDTTVEDDNLGKALAFDGASIVVTSTRHASDSGVAYLYRKTGSSWVQLDRLVRPDNTTPAEFGHAVAVDGPVTLVGAPRDGPMNTGAVYLFLSP